MAQEEHLAPTPKRPRDFCCQSTNIPRVPDLRLLLHMMLCSKPSCFQHTSPSSSRSRASTPSGTWGAGPDAGPGGPGQPWAWDAAPLARLTAHPGDYIWALSGPGGPRPRPCLLPPAHRQAWGGAPRELGPIHGHVPSWTPGPRANGEGEGEDSFGALEEPPSPPHGTETNTSGKSTPPPSPQTERRTFLKGA